MSLAENIKKYRRKYHLSQDDLAEACYVARCTIANWEAGRRMPNYESIVLLSKLFKVTINELLGDDEEANLVLNEKNLNSEFIKNEDNIHTEMIKNISNDENLPLSSSHYRKFKIQAAIVLTILVTIMAVSIPTVYFVTKYRQESLRLEEIEGVTLEILDLEYDNIYYFEQYEKAERSKYNVEQDSDEKKFFIREIDLSDERFTKFWTVSTKKIEINIYIYCDENHKKSLSKIYRMKNIIIQNKNLCKEKGYLYFKNFGIYQMNLRLRSDSCIIDEIIG